MRGFGPGTDPDVAHEVWPSDRALVPEAQHCGEKSRRKARNREWGTGNWEEVGKCEAPLDEAIVYRLAARVEAEGDREVLADFHLAHLEEAEPACGPQAWEIECVPAEAAEPRQPEVPRHDEDADVSQPDRARVEIEPVEPGLRTAERVPTRHGCG